MAFQNIQDTLSPVTELFRRWRCWAFVLLSFATIGRAQTIHWTTNFYSVTGASFREIRQSIERSRPWQDGFDGDTRWRVHWKFTTLQSANGCVCTSFSTTTTITTTMPRWTPPTDIAAAVKEQWTRYYTNLAQHEAGHARLALAAAADIQKAISQMGAQSDCSQLSGLINERADKIVEAYREREREYDRRTAHGTRPADAPARPGPP